MSIELKPESKEISISSIYEERLNLFEHPIIELINYYKDNQSNYYQTSIIGDYFKSLLESTLYEMVFATPNTKYHRTYIVYRDKIVDTCLSFEDSNCDGFDYQGTRYYSDDTRNQIRVFYFSDIELRIEEHWDNESNKYKYWDNEHEYNHQEEKILIWHLLDAFEQYLYKLNDGVLSVAPTNYIKNKIMIEYHHDLISLQYKYKEQAEIFTSDIVNMLKALDTMLYKHNDIRVERTNYWLHDTFSYSETKYQLGSGDDYIRFIINDSEEMFTYQTKSGNEDILFTISENEIIRHDRNEELEDITIPIGYVGTDYVVGLYNNIKSAMFKIITGFSPISNDY